MNGMRAGATFLAVTIAATIIAAERAGAQEQPAAVPVAVAEAMSLGVGAPPGRQRYFAGTVPTGWPPDLVPAGARVIGGGTNEIGRQSRMMVAVFSFESAGAGQDALRGMTAKAGYAQPVDRAAGEEGGFMPTPRSDARLGRFCKDSSELVYRSMGRTQGPNIFAVLLLDGVAGRQGCSSPRPLAAMMARGLPVALPPLEPPAGTTFRPGGSSWGGDAGDTRGALLTTMQVDSILFHYRDQLVAGGWRPQGRPAIGDGIAVQRFTFTEKGDAWVGALEIFEAGDRRDVTIRFSRAP